MPQVIFSGGSGGGSFAPCTNVCRKFTLGEDCVAGDVVRPANSFDAPITNGHVVKALATNDYQSDAIGVVLEDGVAGDEVRIVFDGAQNLTFSSAPLISQTGADIGWLRGCWRRERCQCVSWRSNWGRWRGGGTCSCRRPSPRLWCAHATA